MKNSRILSALTAVLILLTLIPFHNTMAVSEKNSFDLNSAAGILLHPDSGTVLFEKNADTQRAPASITKITTALIIINAIENGELSLDDMVTASDNITFDLEADGSTQNIQPGEQMSLKDLLYCILIASANEACNIVAEYYSGSIAQFVELMNNFAAELGCTGTHYTNTHGLHNDEHYTTARDIAIIAQEGLKHPLFLEIINTRTYTTAATNMSDTRTMQNTNYLITDMYDGYYTYEYCKGGKTGRTSNAGFCLMSYAEKDGVTLICVVLGAEEEVIDENRSGAYSFSESKRLFEWGYTNYGYRTVVSTNDMVAETKVIDGQEADYVVLHPANDLQLFLPYDFDINTIEKVVRLSSVDGVYAPVNEGDLLGSLDIYQDEVYIDSVDLIALTSVDGQAASAENGDNSSGSSNNYTWLKILLVVIILLVLIYLLLLVLNAHRDAKHRKSRQKVGSRHDKK